MAVNLTNLTNSTYRFLGAWSIVRMCPQKIEANEEQLSFNAATLAITLVIFMLARGTIAGANLSVLPSAIATFVSSFIIFATGFVALIFKSDKDWKQTVQKWGIFFSMLWIVSLVIAIIIDGIAVWTGKSPLTTVIIDYFIDPGELSGTFKDFLRAIIISTIALGVLYIKSTNMNGGQKIIDKCMFFTVMFGCAMNCVLMVFFIYGDVV